jgi:DNA processing protein
MPELPSISHPSKQLRDLLIAVNTVAASDRRTACRLGRALALGSAAEAALDGHDSRPLLRRALRLRPRAPAIARREEERCQAVGARLVTILDRDYPPTLHDLELPPPVLYCRGDLGAEPRLAIVGSRRSDPYGLEIAEMFARDLAARGLVIVSGLALGIDAAAHRGAMGAPGRTAAVLGCGIDILYPTRNRRLAEAIPSAGAILSEYPLGTPPLPAHFPVRNRIIAALALATFVVRATPKSGSLITARHALDLGREIFALPGNVLDPRSIGPNSLIRDGAHPVQHPRDIVEALPTAVQLELDSPSAGRSSLSDLGPRSHALLELLPPGEPVAQDQLVARSGLSIDQTLGALLELELAGYVTRHPGPSFVRRATTAC